MTEIFEDLSLEFKKRAALAVELALRQKNLLESAKAIENFSKACNEREQEFIDFVLHMQMEEHNR